MHATDAVESPTSVRLFECEENEYKASSPISSSSSSLRSSLRIKTQRDSLTTTYQPTRKRMNKAVLVSVCVFIKLLDEVRRKKSEKNSYEINNTQSPPSTTNTESQTSSSSLLSDFTHQFDGRDSLMNKSPFAFNDKRGRSTVTFGDVQVRSYETIATHNPAVSSGPAIGIGWNYNNTYQTSVDEYEKNRPPPSEQCKEATDEESMFKLSETERSSRLRDVGYTDKEIQSAVKASTKAKKERQSTIKSLDKSHIHEKWEAAAYKVQTIVRLRKKDTNDIDKLSKRVQKCHYADSTSRFKTSFKTLFNEEKRR